MMVMDQISDWQVIAAICWLAAIGGLTRLAFEWPPQSKPRAIGQVSASIYVSIMATTLLWEHYRSHLPLLIFGAMVSAWMGHDLMPLFIYMVRATLARFGMRVNGNVGGGGGKDMSP